MDDTLRLIQHLYDEDVDDPAFAQRLAEDDTLRREYEQLLDTKAALEQRSTPSPAPNVVDDIVDYAAEAAQAKADSSPTREGRRDRTARTPDRTRNRRLQGIGTVLALLLVAAVGWWQMDAVQSPPANTAASSATVAPPEPADAAPSQTPDSVPNWDDREEVVRLHRRIEMVRDRSNTSAWNDMTQSIDQGAP